MWEFKQIEDLYLRFVSSCNLFIEFIHEVRNATRLPNERTRKSLLTAFEHREKEKGWKFQDYSWNLVSFIHSDFVVITPESSNKFPWISIWRLVKPHANCCVDILNTRWLRLAFVELYWLWRVNQAKERVAVRVCNAPDQWPNWRGQGSEPPPGKLNIKTGPSPSLYFGIYYSFGFQ